ncbi:MAG: ADP-ribosylglycohydrolase family protein [Gammaproteobacteria bacterium]|nr:ADP-ribosylglycohydrolase family protein [Gammaproteobacteria bacterium]
MPDGVARPALETVVPLAKAEGAFLALAAGDALGWPQEVRRKVRGGGGDDDASPQIEFRSWARRGGGRYRPYEETIGAGEYSDDTQLTLAVARSRANHGADWWKAFMRVELPRWTIYERGGGGATKRAAQAWLAGGSPWQSGKSDAGRRYFDAGGNGVAMRVLPHALFLAGRDDPGVLVHDVVRDGAATHGHPRALVGATTCAYAAWSLARRNRTLGFGELLDLLIDEHSAWGAFPDMERGGDAWSAAAGRVLDEPYERLWERTVDEMRRLLEQARNGIREGALADDRAVLDDIGCFGRSKGAGTVTAAGAAYLAARHAAQPAQGVLRAAFEWGADTDTLAAVTGGLLGCLAGDEWLPAPWRDVQDAAYIRCLAGRVARGPSGAERQPVETPATPPSILKDLVRRGDHEVALGDSTRARATALPDLKSLSKSITVRAWRLRTPEGQTLYVTKVEEHRRSRRANRTEASSPPDAPGLPSEPASVRHRRSDSAIAKTCPAAPAVPTGEADVEADRSDALYGEFRRHLRALLSHGPARPKRIEAALGLIPQQARKWLERAEQDGEVERASRKPLTFALIRKSLL